MREKQHGGRQNTPVLVTFRITRPAAPDVLSQPSPARNIFHSPGNITSQWTQLLCTAHYTPPGAALKPEVLDVMWSNFRKDMSLSLLSRVTKCIMSQNKRGDIYSKSIAVGGLVNYHKYEAQETSGIILFPFLWGRRNATARCSADIIYKTQKRVCGVCWVSASPCAAGQCPCHDMSRDTCHVSAPALDTCARPGAGPGAMLSRLPSPSLPSDSKYLLNCGSSSARLLLRAVKEPSRSFTVPREGP